MKHHPTHKKLRFVRALSLSLALCVLLGTVFSLPIIAIDTHTAVDTNNDGFCEYEGCGGVHVDETNFPDENFRNWVTSKITGADDGILTAAELDAVTSIDCHGESIENLKGIERFTELEKLYCYGNSYLSKLDLSQCTELVYLNVNTCTALQTLNISNCTKLTELYASQIKASIPDFSIYPELTHLTYTSQSNLSSLNLSANKKLIKLECSNNALTTLDLSENTELTTLYCLGNQLTSLDLSANTKLTFLDCKQNQLTTLDLSKNTELTDLFCQENRFASLDLSTNTKLTAVNATQTPVVMLNDSNLTYDLKEIVRDISKISGLVGGKLNTETGILTLSNPDNSAALTVTYTYDTGIAEKPMSVTLTVEVTHTHSYDEKDYCAVCKSLRISEKSFPDANFREFITDTDTEGKANVAGADDGILTEAERLAVTYLDMESKSIADLTGIAFFPALLKLICNSNNLTALDLSGNLKLTSLNCKSNQITSLNISSNTALTDLRCSGNPLGTLNLSASTELGILYCDGCDLTSLNLGSKQRLKSLYCQSNRLITLDVSDCPVLEILDCNSNQLAALDITSNTALIRLNCSSNKLRTLDVSQNTALVSLVCAYNHLTKLPLNRPDLLVENIAFSPQVYSVELTWGATFDLSGLVDDISKVSVTSGGTMDVNGVLTFDWTEETVAAVYEYDTGAPEKLTVSVTVVAPHTHDFGTTDICSLCGVIKIGEKTFPDANFRSFVSENYDFNSDGVLSPSERQGISHINVSNLNIADLTGIEYFPNIWELNCSKNTLTSLDMSKNTELKYLYCYQNNLTVLDVSKCPNLLSLDCRYNDLLSLDVTNNTELDFFQCAYNSLTSLNLRNNSKLSDLFCDGNRLTALYAEAAYNPLLTDISCGGQTAYFYVPAGITNFNLGALVTKEDITVTSGGEYDSETGYIKLSSTSGWCTITYTHTPRGLNTSMDVTLSLYFTSDPVNTFEEVSVTLGSDLSLNVYVPDIGYPAPTMRFTFNGKETTVNGVASQGVYKFTFTGIAPQNIGDTVKMDLFSYNWLESKEYSVLEYLNSLKSKSAADLGYTDAQYVAMVTLIDDLLVYGGAAQAFTDHTGTRVDTGITGSNTVAASTDTAGDPTGMYVTFNGMNVFFDNTNRLMFRFAAPDTTGLTFTVRVNGGAEQAISYSPDGNGNYILTTDAIKATGFDDIYTVTAYKNGVQDTSLSYSVRSYVYAMQNGTDEMAALAKATYAYGCSAKAFAQALAAST